MPGVEDAVTRLVQRYVAGARFMVLAGNGRLIVRIAHPYISAVSIDQLACRLSRARGIVRLSAKLNRVGLGTVYTARMRGR